MSVASIFAIVFRPSQSYHLLSDTHNPTDDTRYDLSFIRAVTVGEEASDDLIVYQDILKKILSNTSLEYLEHIAEPGVIEGLEKFYNPSEYKYRVRLKSNVTPKLILKNQSFAVFDVVSTVSVLKINEGETDIQSGHLETVHETVRIANTGLGLRVRHIEQIAASHEMKSFAQQQSGGERLEVNAWHDDQANKAIRKVNDELGLRSRYQNESYQLQLMISSRQLSLHQRNRQKIVGFNYYPRSAPWNKFWEDFPVEEISADFERISSLGANTVRVFLNRRSFENSSERAEAYNKLVTLLDLADSNDISVILTTFDFGANYSLNEMGASWGHLRDILEQVYRHPALLAVDLKNEPDRDFKSWGEQNVVHWLSTLLHLSNIEFPDVQFTIGWSDAAYAHILSDQLDIISFHDFGDVDTLSKRVKHVTRIAQGKPVWLTEIGHSKWSPIPGGKKQVDQFSTQVSQLQSVDGVLVWTLNDFEHVPTEVAGWRPWRKAMQANYGISSASERQLSKFFNTKRYPQDVRIQNGVTP
ncbi:MAG: glycosyl hydrolase [Hyphomonas sp.]